MILIQVINQIKKIDMLICILIITNSKSLNMKKSIILLAFITFAFVSGQNDTQTFQDLKQLEEKIQG